MYRNQLVSTGLSLCLALGLLAAPTFSADLATVHLGADGVDWQPTADAASWVLTVSGPEGFYLQEEFGTAPSMSLFTADGQFLADGLYKYELRAIPRISPQLRQDLDAAAGDLKQRERLAARVQGLGGAQSGHFRISQGVLVQGDQVELPAPGGGVTVPSGDLAVSQTVPEGSLDHLQVFNMDVLINGSLCVGFDCGSSQSFGFDTVRLRENNLRVHFDDTSSSGSFPRNDWRLTANDSANGGANRFSIEDATAGQNVFTIEAGAPANTLYVDSAKRVGIGTSTPAVLAHAVDGNTPTLRLEQDGSSGFTPQTWDLGGNEANFFVRDITNGSLLPFRIRPGAPTSSIDIAADGDVGFGTTSPSAPLHVQRANGSAKIVVEEASSTEAARELAQFQNNGTVTYRFTDTQGTASGSDDFNWIAGLRTNNQFIITLVGTIGSPLWQMDPSGNVTATSFNPTSSRELKEGFESINAREVLARVSKLPIAEWQYRDDVTGARHIGPTAEDFKATFGLNGPDEKHLSLTDLSGVALVAIQGLQQELETKEEEIAGLKQNNREMSERVEALERLMASLAPADE